MKASIVDGRIISGPRDMPGGVVELAERFYEFAGPGLGAVIGDAVLDERSPHRPPLAGGRFANQLILAHGDIVSRDYRVVAGADGRLAMRAENASVIGDWD